MFVIVSEMGKGRQRSSAGRGGGEQGEFSYFQSGELGGHLSNVCLKEEN